MCVACACYLRAMYVLCACYVRAMWLLCACYVRAMCGLRAFHVRAMCLLYACYVRAVCVRCACYMCACYACIRLYTRGISSLYAWADPGELFPHAVYKRHVCPGSNTDAEAEAALSLRMCLDGFLTGWLDFFTSRTFGQRDTWPGGKGMQKYWF